MEELAVALINITAIISFTWLAGHCDKWWIALFAILFMMGTSYKKETSNWPSFEYPIKPYLEIFSERKVREKNKEKNKDVKK